MLIAAAAGLLLALAAPQSRSKEAEVLGGPCLEEGEAGSAGLHQWHELVSRELQAERRGDRQSAAELARQIVRFRCSNEHWWLRLAELLAAAGRTEESLAALEVLYSRRSNAVDRRLRAPESPLRRLLESGAYRRSALAARLAQDRRALEQRRKESRAKLEAVARPPANYVAKNACPFECCAFGSWTVLEDTALFDRPGGSEVAGWVRKGEQVEALTGEVHLRPLPVLVRFPPAGLAAAEGSIVFLLDYLGEGHGRVWVDGRLAETEILSVHEHCAFPGPDCWGEFVNPEDAGRQRDGVWWVQLKTREGAAGWTREVRRFTGMGRCGGLGP